MDATLNSLERAIKDEGVNSYFIKLFLLAAVYIGSAQIGFSLGMTFDQVTTIWPPSGIALTAMLFWGYHYWPAIFMGAFIANYLAGVSPLFSTMIAVGNTLEVIAALFLINRFIPKAAILEKISGVMHFVVLAPFISSLIAATIGTLSLVLAGLVANNQFTDAWLTWWVGDMMGMLIIVPLVVAWSKKDYRKQLVGHVYEGVALLLVVVMTSLLIFTQPPHLNTTTLSLVYIIFPLIIFAAIRFTQIGAVTAGTVIAVTAISSTLADKGPYARSDLLENNIFALHFFLLVAMITALVLSVAVYDRLRSEQALIKKARELEEAQEQILRNVEWRQDLQSQVNEATKKINNILTGILEEDTNDKPPPKNNER